ncbi:hypothetical protein N7508_001343 [Penicillium antarcticum]|uniref:uncharacterized protein n=1 Tax=Penicillium antarcticum TaxID=416450 RepID=UPI002398F8E0|nr:uncharacterized protein N7508_001343 [Penicillium antarcticum]KAJ5316835.1 hypothetical protein N7508_001343 [Penicillium antarcticum]
MLEPDELSQELQGLYCPPIDPALFMAILMDYDLSMPAEVGALRDTLNELKTSALDQENLPFDPTGTTNTRNLQDANLPESLSWSPLDNIDVNDCDENDNNQNGGHDARLRYTFLGMTSDDKVYNLISMFPSVPRHQAERILEECHGSLSRAMEVLLNLAFIDETQIARGSAQETPAEAAAMSQALAPRSIDGFQADESQTKKSRKKNKKRNQQLRRDATSSQALNTPSVNKWEMGKKDIDFISIRASVLLRENVASTYHENSMSLCATIRALAIAYAPRDIGELDDDDAIIPQVAELSHKYAAIPETTIAGLLRISNNEIIAADELAEALAQGPVLNSLSDIITFTSAPLVLDPEETTVAASAENFVETSSDMDYGQAAAAANAHFALRSNAFAQASQAARRARSNPLYNGASAYYREIGNEQRQLAMRHLATASDRLVDRQSSQYDLDLHGVTVPNAIRISRERVNAWWHSLGELKHIRGGGKHVHGGFKIVVGVGNHSRDGAARIGPAVYRMLESEGWKVECDRGVLLVTGHRR